MKNSFFIRSLRYKFSLPLTFVALLLITSISMLYYYSLVKGLKNQLMEYGEMLSLTITESTESVENYDQMRYSLESLTLKTSSIYGITLVSKDPFIIWASSFHPKGDIDRYTQEMLTAVKLSSEQGIFGHFFYADGDLAILKPIEVLFAEETDNVDASAKANLQLPPGLNPEQMYFLDPKRFNGVLYLRFDWSVIKSSVQGDFIRNIIIAATGTLLMLLLSIFLLYRLVLTPVKIINDMSIKHLQGNIDIRLAPLSNDEFGDLGNSLNHMLDKIQENDERFRSLYELLPDPAWIIDNNKFIECNQAAVSIMGYATKEALLNSHPAQLSPEIQPDGENSFNKSNQMMKLAINKGIHRFEWVHLRADGTSFNAEITLSSIFLNERPVLYCVWRDITEYKQLEQELIKAKIEAEKLAITKSQFLATMSHEIRTPMNGVLGMTELLSETKLDNTQKEYLDTIYSSGQTLLSIINDILDFSKLEAGKMKIDPVNFNLKTAILDVKVLLETKALDKNIQLIVKFSPQCADYVRCDINRLKQILFNLIGNAIKFTEQGHVKVEVSVADKLYDEPLLFIDIEDTGIGIEAEKQEKLFLPFTQANTSTTRVYGGTGLGLSISKRFIELMGGEICLQSRPQQGTVFRIILPVSIVDSAEFSEYTQLNAVASASLNILLVEDVIVNQKIAKAMLKKLKHQVTIADNGEQAIELFKETKFDLILMDCLMPVMDGFEATKRIREMENKGSRIPIIALTANAQESDRKVCLQVGMDDFITKPISKNQLALVIDKCINS